MYDSDFMASGIEKKWWVSPGFKIEQMVTELDLPVNLAFVPEPGDKSNDPLLYVIELYGQIKAVTSAWKVHTYAENLLNFKPDHINPRGRGIRSHRYLC